nr:reverse transcriptase domain-containing protein [Tanacetum cinerariifolium]
MRTRSSSNLPGESSPNPTSSNPKRRNRRCSKQAFILEESIDTMADQRTMAELLCAPTKGYTEAIVVPPILAEHFELKHSLINMMTSDQFFGLKKDNPHDHIRWFNKITSTIKYKDVPDRTWAALRWLEKEPPRSILTWEDLVSKFINEFFPPSRTTNLRNEISNFQQRFDELFHEAWDRYKDLLPNQDSLNSVVGGNLLERRTQDVLTIIENKSKVRNSQNKSIVSQVKSSDANSSSSFEIAKLTHAVNQQTSDVTTAMNAILKQFQATPAFIKFVEEICVTCGGAHLPLPSNTIANPKGKLKAFTTRSGIVLDGPSFPMPPPFNNPEEDEPGIARYVFVPVGKFTFPADFFIVDYESDPRVPLILGSPFLRTARSLIDIHGEEIILCDGDERLTINMRHDTSSYSNQPQKESINMINIFNDSCEDFLKDLFTPNHLSGNPTFSFHSDLTSPEVKDDIFYPKGDMVLIKKLINLDSTKDLLPSYNINLLSSSTTSSSPNHLLKEFIDELALITFLPGNDDLLFDIEFNLKEIEYLLNHDPIKEMDSILEDSVDEDNLANHNDNLVYTMPEMFTDEHALDYSSPPLYDEYDDDLFEVESDTEYVYNDPFDSKEDEIKKSKLLNDELDLPRSSDFLPSPGYDSFLFEDFFRDKNVNKLSISHASLILEDFDPPPLYELPFHKEVPGSKTLLSFSSKNEEKVFKPRILTSKGVHSSLLSELSHRGPKVFKVIKNLESPMEIFPCSFVEDIRILDVLCLHFYHL